MSMHFDFQSVDSLPRLAWCAELRQGSERVYVLHGPWVETGTDFFVEGAWDGAFDRRDFAGAVTFCGSGGRITTEGVVFSGPSHNLERLYSVRVGPQLWISNSLVFVLVCSGQELDLSHPGYFFDLLRFYRRGLGLENKTLPTASGTRIHLFECENLRIDRGLSVTRTPRDFGPEPTDYDAYVDYLQGTVSRVVENARDPARGRPFRPVTAISRGYDSPAVSVLASRAGCTEAVTFLRSRSPTTGYSPDDGREIASRLGLAVTTYERHDVLTRDDLGPAEMFMNVFRPTESHNRLMADQVAGTLWMNGRHGEQFWSLDPRASRPGLQDPASTTATGTNHSEARLRIGYMSFPVPYTLGVYAPDLNRISRSADMAPWRVGGGYDRPIPRRILETADVPRELFGQAKLGGGGHGPEVRKLRPPWEQDFLAYYHERVPAAVRATLVDEQVGSVPYYGSSKMGRREQWFRSQPLLVGLVERVLKDRTHRMWRSRWLYTFHWGVEGVRGRYQAPPRRSNANLAE
jgi:hypothetical protein